MLKQVYLDALKTREQKISRIRDSNYGVISKEAGARWVYYRPSPKPSSSAGVDSSWNKRAFQGRSLFIIDAVAISSTNDMIASDYVDEIAESARNESLEARAMAMEATVAEKAGDSGKADIICIDGSVVARLGKIGSEAAAREAKKYGKCVFVAKSSDSRAQFGSLGSRAGDIYYYNRISNSTAGYSVPLSVDTPYGPISEVYTRLRDSTPMLRLEILAQASDKETRDILDSLCYHSVSGYPYCLKLAHNACKVSDQDVDRIASIFSLQNEHGARDALNE